MEKSNLLISIVIPCLNEEKTLAICIERAKKAFHALKVEGEVVVADNGSTDNSKNIARQLGARVVEVPQKGYGSALIEGFKAANGKYLIMGDADDSYNLEEIGPYIEKLNEGFDFVIGNRFKGVIEKGAMPNIHRYFGTPALTKALNFLFRTKIGDVNCGMRGLSKEAFNRMHLKAVGMEFATEMIIKASLRKLKIAEVPCNLYKDKRDRRPHLNTWRDGWRHLRFMLLFASSKVFFIPGLILLGLGILGMITLFLRDIINPVALVFITQKHILSFMLLSLFGFQIICLGLAAQSFGYSEYFDKDKKSIIFLKEYFNLERGIIGGGGFCLLGGLMLLYLLISYYFRFLPYLNDLIRFDLAVFAIAFFLIGVQIIYTSFLLSLFYLKVK